MEGAQPHQPWPISTVSILQRRPLRHEELMSTCSTGAGGGLVWFVVPRTEPLASHKQGKSSTVRFHSQPLKSWCQSLLGSPFLSATFPRSELEKIMSEPIPRGHSQSQLHCFGSPSRKQRGHSPSGVPGGANSAPDTHWWQPRW